MCYILIEQDGHTKGPITQLYRKISEPLNAIRFNLNALNKGARNLKISSRDKTRYNIQQFEQQLLHL